MSLRAEITMRSFFRQPGLAHAFKQGRHIRKTRDHPFDGEFGIEAAGFRQGGLRLVHLACERIGGGQIWVCEETAKAGVDCLVVFVDSGVEMPEAKFCIAQRHMPQTDICIART